MTSTSVTSILSQDALPFMMKTVDAVNSVKISSSTSVPSSAVTITTSSSFEKPSFSLPVSYFHIKDQPYTIKIMMKDK